MGIGGIYEGWGQLVTVAIMAVALGMDAFSLGVGIGMKGIRLLHVLQLSLLIAFFMCLCRCSACSQAAMSAICWVR